MLPFPRNHWAKACESLGPTTVSVRRQVTIAREIRVLQLSIGLTHLVVNSADVPSGSIITDC